MIHTLTSLAILPLLTSALRTKSIATTTGKPSHSIIFCGTGDSKCAQGEPLQLRDLPISSTTAIAVPTTLVTQIVREDGTTQKAGRPFPFPFPFGSPPQATAPATVAGQPDIPAPISDQPVIPATTTTAAGRPKIPAPLTNKPVVPPAESMTTILRHLYTTISELPASFTGTDLPYEAWPSNMPALPGLRKEHKDQGEIYWLPGSKQPKLREEVPKAFPGGHAPRKGQEEEQSSKM